MKNVSFKKWFTLLTMLALVGVVASMQNCAEHLDYSADSLSVSGLEGRSLEIRRLHCAGCHEEPDAQAEPSRILDNEFLISGNWVIPGDPENSPLYQALFTNMPKNNPPLDPAVIAELRAWIVGLDQDNSPPAKLVFNPTNTTTFGNVTTGSSVDLAFTIANSGERDASAIKIKLLNPPFAPKGGKFPGTGGTCTLVLAPSASCTLILSFTPSAPGPAMGRLELEYDDGTGLKVTALDLTGTGQGAPVGQLTIAESSHDFGLVSIGSSKARTFSVRNVGAAEVTSVSAAGLSAALRFKGGNYPGTAGTCAGSLAAGSQCSIEMEFAPLVQGAHDVTMTLNYNTGGLARAATLGLTGQGASATVTYAQIRPILLDGVSCLNCHNTTGSYDFNTYANIMAFKRGGATPAVSGGATSRFAERIKAASAGKPQMGATVGSAAYGNLSSADRDLILAWLAAGAPEGSPSPADLEIQHTANTYDFGMQTLGATASATLTVRNKGMQAATSMTGGGLAPPFDFDGGSYPGTGGTCSTTLAADSTCTIKLNFKPTAAVTSNDSLEINYSAGGAARVAMRPLAGTGTALPFADLEIMPATYEFRTREVGTVTDATFTVRNKGTGPASALTLTGISAPLSIASTTCGMTLGAGLTCNVILRFTPTGMGGDVSNVLMAAYATGLGNTANVTATVSGTGLPVETGNVYYSEIKNILMSRDCKSCHSSDFGNYAAIIAFYQPLVTSGTAPPPALQGGINSRFWNRVSGVASPSASNMRKNLTATDLAKIRRWLMNGFPNDPQDRPTIADAPLLGDRYYIVSVLQKTFGTSTAAIANYRALMSRADLFGSACHIQDHVYANDTSKTNYKFFPMSFYDRCGYENTLEVRTGATQARSPDIVSEGERMNLCLMLTYDDAIVKSALTRLGLSATSPMTAFNATEVTKVYSRFYPGRTLSSAAAAALVAIGTTATTNPLVGGPGANAEDKKYEGWRFILYSVCLSSGWQAP